MATPDDKMGLPIENLVLGAVELVFRAAKWLALPAETLTRPDVWAIFQNEDKISHAYCTALRARAPEVVQLCERIGLRGCTTALVRDNPLLVVMAIEGQLRRLEARGARTGKPKT